MNDCLIAFGANMGDARNTFKNVIDSLNEEKQIYQCAHSRIHKTTPIGGNPRQNDYLNAAIRFKTELNPESLHQLLSKIEKNFGRQRTELRWDPRTADLDLLLFSDLVVESNRLQIPHPRMSFRRFVLEPAVEIGGDMIHPVSGLTLQVLLDRLNEQPNVILVVGCNEHEFSQLQQCFENVSQIDCCWISKSDGSNMACAMDGTNDVSNAVKSCWTIERVDNVEQFQMRATSAKLVVLAQSHQQPQLSQTNSSLGELGSQAACFAGSTLSIDKKNLEMAAHEFAAALSAMAPIQA